MTKHTNPALLPLAGLSRRRFLQALLALGLPLPLQAPVAEKSDTEIDALWETATTHPLVFAVDDQTIQAQGVEYPSTYQDVVDIRSPFKRRKEVLLEMEDCPELYEHFQCLFLEAMDAGERKAEALFAAHGDEGTNAWVATLPLKRINAEVQEWLQAPLPLSYEIPEHLGPVGEAYGFFAGLDHATCEALGVVIVEGEHPGSSYYAAELHKPLAEANAMAAQLGLPIRFA